MLFVCVVLVVIAVISLLGRMDEFKDDGANKSKCCGCDGRKPVFVRIETDASA